MLSSVWHLSSNIIMSSRTVISSSRSILGTSISSYLTSMGKMGKVPIGSRLNDTAISTSPHETRRCMSKYLSKSATKRLPLNTKRAKKGYYKGKGGTSEGRLTSKGKFIADPLKKLQLIVPDLTGFKLKPYIAKTISKIPPENRIENMPGR